jgi:hypothetical protein
MAVRGWWLGGHSVLIEGCLAILWKLSANQIRPGQHFLPMAFVVVLGACLKRLAGLFALEYVHFVSRFFSLTILIAFWIRLSSSVLCNMQGSRG